VIDQCSFVLSFITNVVTSEASVCHVPLQELRVREQQHPSKQFNYPRQCRCSTLIWSKLSYARKPFSTFRKSTHITRKIRRIFTSNSFNKPKIFTNAVLHTNDITALIRDTEYHERALFSIVSPSDLTVTQESNEDPARRSTVFNIHNEGLDTGNMQPPPKRSKAVATVLGGDMADRIKRERAADSANGRRRTGVGQEGLDIELLLRGAEKLCAV